MGRCKTCRRPRKGHVGPLGLKCTMTVIEVSAEDIINNSASEEDEESPTFGEDGNRLRGAGGPTTRGMSDGTNDATMAELMRQLSIMSSDLQKFADDNKMLATSHLQLQKRMETMAPSERDGKSVGILAALAAIGLPVLAEQPISMFNGARVNKKTLTAAKNREFCNLADFVPSTEPCSTLESTIDERSGNLIFKSKSARRSIDNFLMWSSAWCAYESLIMEVDPAM